MITKISIDNIRGFESVELDVNIRPNVPNLVVAPNGFGKSSLSTAFKCAQGTRLEVSKPEKYQNDESRPSILKIEVDGNLLEANSAKNEISHWAGIFVIKSSIEPKAKLPKINGFTVAKPYMQIPDLDLGSAPQKENLNYSSATAKSKLSKNQKAIPNLTRLLSEPTCRENLLENLNEIDRTKQEKSSRIFTKLLQFIENESSTVAEIYNRVKQKFYSEVAEVDCLAILVKSILDHNNSISWAAALLLCEQLRALCLKDRSNLKKWLQRGEYEARVHRANEFIADINSGWVSAELKESKGRLSIAFPDASSLSNGQRDLLFFTCSLLKANNQNPSKSSILIVDEIFDYLDDANLLVAQYFLSRLINSFRTNGGTLYLLILTHLDPAFFKGYALKKQNVVYLGTVVQRVSETMKKIILYRQNQLWSTKLPKYFLHYHPDECDLSDIFNREFCLPKIHGKSHQFYTFLREEWNKLDADESDYDPFAVCAFLRIEIERKIFHKIPTQAGKDEFLNTNGTANKIGYAESVGIEVPEVCLLLGVIYNEALHQKHALNESSIIAVKLKNIALRGMMKNAIAW